MKNHLSQKTIQSTPKPFEHLYHLSNCIRDFHNMFRILWLFGCFRADPSRVQGGKRKGIGETDIKERPNTFVCPGIRNETKNPTYKTQYKLKFNSLDFEMVIKINSQDGKTPNTIQHFTPRYLNISQIKQYHKGTDDFVQLTVLFSVLHFFWG